MEYLVAAAGVLVLLAVYLVWLAGRIERLHARCAAARAALDVQLARRASVAAGSAVSAAPGPPAGELHRVATATLATDPADAEAREAAENDLTRALRRAVPHLPDPVRAEVAAVSRRLAVARQVYNDTVRDTLALRNARLPRAFRLGARHSTPRYFDIDELDAGWVDAPHLPASVPTARAAGAAVASGEATPDPG